MYFLLYINTVRWISSFGWPEVVTPPSYSPILRQRELAWHTKWEKNERENEILKELPELEREKSEGLHEENSYLRSVFQNRDEAKKCCMMPIFKVLEMWRLFIELLKEPAQS